MIFYERLTIKTSLTPQAAQQRLSEQVESRKFFGRWFWEKHKPYEGEVDDERFLILRVFYSRNSFRPVILGKFEPAMGGCLVKVTMRPDLFVLAFIVLWLFLWCGLTAGALGGEFSSMESLSQMSLNIMLGFVAVPFFIGIVMLISFKIEAARSKRFLLELFEGQEVDENGA